MPLAAGRGEQDVVRRHLLPACLVQVLADVLRVGVVGAVPFNGHRPVVCRPENLDACGARAGAPSAEAGEQVDCCGHGDTSSGTFTLFIDQTTEPADDIPGLAGLIVLAGSASRISEI
ncbi:hypothetical protein D3C76_644890 [compost metagenome]